jgi:thiol-disulfide isomerase/thioredoxin
MRKNILLLISVLITAAFLATCSSNNAEQGSGQSGAVDTGSQVAAQAVPAATEFAFAVPDITGAPQQLTHWLGQQPVVVNFWGTWCPPCRGEIPDLVRLYAEYRPQGVEIIGLAVRDYPQKVKQFTDQMGMDWVQLMATDRSAQAFRLTGAVPTTIFYNSRGQEVARFVGARNYDTFKDAFEKIAAI